MRDVFNALGVNNPSCIDNKVINGVCTVPCGPNWLLDHKANSDSLHWNS